MIKAVIVNQLSMAKFSMALKLKPPILILWVDFTRWVGASIKAYLRGMSDGWRIYCLLSISDMILPVLACTNVARSYLGIFYLDTSHINTIESASIILIIADDIYLKSISSKYE